MAPNPEMTIDDRRAIQKKMEALNDGSWKKIASENNFDENEVYFWVLIEDAEKAKKSYDIIIDVLRNSLEKFPNTEFVLSFNQIDQDSKIIVESFQNKDLRTGRVPTQFGLRPSVFKKQEYTVFDRDF